MSSGRVVTVTLEGLTTQLAEQIFLGGVVMFYHNDIGQFMYFRRDNNEMWCEKWVVLKQKVHRGVITGAKSDQPIIVEASRSDRMMRTPLYPMLVGFKQVSCPAYLILNQSGDFTLNDHTPYSFTSKEVHDATVSKLAQLVASNHT